MKKHLKTLLLTGFWLISLTFLSNSYSQQTRPVFHNHEHTPSIHAFINASIFDEEFNQIENATLVIRDGLIESAGKEVAIPKDAIVHDLKGAWIYPGFIDPYSSFGTTVTKKVRHGWGDPPQYKSKRVGPYSWNEAVKSHHSTAEGFKPEPKKASELRALGFTMVNSVPDDGIFRGRSCIANLSDKEASEMIQKSRGNACMSFEKGSSKQSYPSSLMGAIALIRQALNDARWYELAHLAYQSRRLSEKPEINLSLEAINEGKKLETPIIFSTTNYLNTLRASKIGEEFGLNFAYQTSGDEYKRIDAIKNLNSSLIIPLNFPKPLDLSSPEATREASLAKMREWEQAPSNAAGLSKAGVSFSFTLSGLKKESEIKNALRKAIDHGLSEKETLLALTQNPAKLIGMGGIAGKLQKGYQANFFISSGNYFEKESVIYQTWVKGEQYNIKDIPKTDPRGVWSWTENGEKIDITISGKSLSKLNIKSQFPGDSASAKGSLSIDGYRFNIKLINKTKGAYLISGDVIDKKLKGFSLGPDGLRRPFNAEFVKNVEPKPEKKEDKKENETASAVSYPNMAYGLKAIPDQKTWLIKNVTLWTNSEKGIMEKADVLIRAGKIEKVGSGLKAPNGAQVIDGTGKHMTPGIIDEHSHIAISQGVNEGTHAVTAEVRISDVVNSDDVNIYRQLAGGVTTSQLLHGSANPIGGQSAIIKLRWGSLPEDMKFKEAPGFIKFALGENVKQSNWGDKYRTRYPQTRLGVEQLFKDAFQSAKDYRKQKEEARIKNLPFRTDLQKETLLEILDEKRNITCHSYVQSELNMLMKTANEVGFKVNTFTHVLEGYKVADKIKANNVNASTFSDWWAYKYEVIDAIPYNAAILNEVGVNVCINSDDAEMGRRLNQEAAKAVKYGGMSEEDALKMVTLNPAKALHLDEYVGSIEKGKHADVVIWSDHPLSIYSKAERTFVDGRLYFDIDQDLKMRKEIRIERAALIQKILKTGKGEKQAAGGSKGPKLYHCETIESDYSNEY